MKWNIFLLLMLMSEFFIEVQSAPSKSQKSRHSPNTKKDTKNTENKSSKTVENKKSGGKKKSAQTQIVGGTTATQTKWPWQVAINTLQDGQYKFRCGGSLVASDVVLTAAHCLRNPDATPDMVKIIAGDHERGINEGTEQTKNVAKIIIHPSYTGTLSSLYSNDIALLKLVQPVSSTDVVSTITLAPQNATIDSSAACVITGWGISDTKAISNSLTTTLSQAEVGILSNDECNKRKNWDGLIKPFQMCAYNKRISACLGDSGGPLVCKVNNKFVQYGVTSWGSKSCDRKPSVFTRVSYYFMWIQEAIAAFDAEVNNSSA